MADLIESHIPYAHAIAAELLCRFPTRIERREVEAAAEYGLVQAANAYDAARGVAFTTFAYYRIRGAVFDLLRETTRVARFEEAANEYMADYSNAESSATSSYEDVKNLATDIVASYFLSLESMSEEPQAEGAEAPINALLRREQESMVKQALRNLPEKNRQVLQAYYYENLTLDEIGKRLGLSKSWVSRMHAKGLELLRPALQAALSTKL